MKIHKDIKFSQKLEEKERLEKYRTLKRRIVSAFIDISFMLCINIVIGFLLFVLMGKKGYPYLILISQIIMVLYNVFMVKKYGGSIGKLFTNLQVVDSKKENYVSTSQAIKREALNILSIVFNICKINIYFTSVSFFMFEEYQNFGLKNPLISLLSLLIFVLSYIELFSAILSKKRRSFHDLIAGTVVIKKNVLLKRTIIIGFVCFVILMRLYGFVLKMYF